MPLQPGLTGLVETQLQQFQQADGDIFFVFKVHKLPLCNGCMATRLCILFSALEQPIVTLIWTFSTNQLQHLT